MFIVYDENMNLKPFPNGMLPLDIYIPSMQRERNTSSMDGSDGIIDKGYVFTTRPPSVDVGLISQDTKDFRLLRDVAFNFFNNHDYLYVSETHQKGKRYKVTITESFIPERLTQEMAIASFSLEMYELPFAESIGTTQDIQLNGIDTDSELWGFGMGLIADDESLIYTHETNEFRIYNAGNRPIHPFQQELKITISNVVGSDNYLQLRNVTTGTTFRVNEKVRDTQVIVLDGPNVTSNGLQFLRSTNKEFIEIAPWWNDFRLTGAKSVTIEFDFRFYYA
ncbi:phage tail domain-containing protein [Virgibacillus salexigens]|uniref:Phage tail protein n=1 Tax=Virgibacillus massiliensis TaxID=1462526 RepID=A0A024QAL0_9BACI|nr:phage tail domain-containing protein [Virgibacillus massiliensis]CDQ39558.1 Phage tail protein [Virgibacillus massiliensis]